MDQYDLLDKSKVYCPKCLTEMILEKDRYQYQCHCWDELKYPYTLRWCEDCKHWTQARGSKLITKCYGCQAKRQAEVYGSNLLKWAKSEAGAKTRRENGIKCLNRHWADPEWKMSHLKKIHDAGGVWYEERFCETCGGVRQFMYGKYCRGHDKEHCGNVDLLQPAFTEIDGVLHYNASDGVLIPWHDYKAKFMQKKDPNLEYLHKDALIVSTFRTQESDTWKGALAAFNQFLLDLNVRYFTYIKYYILPNGERKMLVIGKSGSLSVNGEGTDVDFGEWDGVDVLSKNHTPARIFLFENKLHWDKTKIVLIPCKSEEDALFLEKDIHGRFGLFYS